MTPSFPGSRGLLAAAATCVAWACATNPATGRRELMLVSEGQEIAMGRQADPEIVATFGVYADAAWGTTSPTSGSAWPACPSVPTFPGRFECWTIPW